VELGHNYIGTEHLLLGVLREQEGVAARVLLEAGRDLGPVRREVLERLRVGRVEGRQPMDSYRGRLAVVEALLAALERRDEVVTAIGEAADRRAAKEALQRLLGIPGELAKDVLDLRLTRLTRDEVEHLRQERRELLDRLDELGDEA
jgi:DNA gyrase/topoisomerase IV subunit A